MRRATRRCKVGETPAFMTAFVALNTQKKPLDNPKVRQALNDGVRPRSTYLKAVFDNTATPAVNPYPAEHLELRQVGERVPTYPADKAKKLLADAGFPERL